MARLITPEAIASYPTLDRPNEKGKYAISLIFRDGFPDELRKAALKALKEEYGERLKGAKREVFRTQYGPFNFLVLEDGTNIRLPWRDQPEDVAKKGYPEGSAFISPNTEMRPQVVSLAPDTSKEPDEDGNYPPTMIENHIIEYGDIVQASVNAYCYDNDGNEGVTFGLGNVALVRKAQELGARGIPAEDEFASDPDAVADLSDLTDEDMADDGEPVAVASDGSEAEEDDLSDLLG